jgi:hypothetical protein
VAVSDSSDRRRRVERGVYQQPNGKYAVCVRVDGRARFRTVEATTLVEAREQRVLLQEAGRLGVLPPRPGSLSPRSRAAGSPSPRRRRWRASGVTGPLISIAHSCTVTCYLASADAAWC